MRNLLRIMLTTLIMMAPRKAERKLSIVKSRSSRSANHAVKYSIPALMMRVNRPKVTICSRQVTQETNGLMLTLIT